jgi:DinB family protein
VPNTSLTVEQVLTLLADMPARIAGITAGLTAAQARTRPEEGEWSVAEVLAHLRACSDVWGDRCIGTILAQDGPTVPGINPRAWIERTDYPTLPFRPSLRVYTAQRADLMTVLELLPPEGWSRTATVTGGGPPRQRTVLFYAQWLAGHERAHVRQFVKTVNAVRMAASVATSQR